MSNETWPDGGPVTPWADPWHDIAGDVRDAVKKIEESSYLARNEIWVAFCAPGRRPVAMLQCVMQQERVVAVHETPWLDGKQDVLLVNVSKMPAYMRDLFLRPPKETDRDRRRRDLYRNEEDTKETP